MREAPAIAPEQPHIVVRVGAALVALPISVVERSEDLAPRPVVDLGVLLELTPSQVVRPAVLALRTAAGVVPVGIDAIEDVLQAAIVHALPALTRLTRDSVVRGVAPLDAVENPRCAVVLDGARLGDLVAEHLWATEGRG